MGRWIVKLLPLAARSLHNRRATATLTVFAIAVSVMLLLGVEKVRTGARESFANTISGTDLIVGARTGEVQLLLSSIFRIGSATNTIAWETAEEIAALPHVEWTVPLSMGDVHRGYRVLGTSGGYFTRYRYGRKQPLSFSAGGPFEDLFDAVLGADVAKELRYGLGDRIELTHGLDDHDVGLSKHEDKPFVVTGILARTGTPVDRAVHISLEGMEAVHVDWMGGGNFPGEALSVNEVRMMDLSPDAVTALLVGLSDRRAALGVQRAVNTYKGEPLLAILPGVALQQLWDIMGTAESALLAVSILVVATGLLGMVTMSLAGLNERRREMAILRSVGARPVHIFGLLVTEAGTLAALGAAIGLAGLYCALFLLQPWIVARYGLYIPISPPGLRDWLILAAVIAVGLAAGFVPAWRGYRYSVADGMMVQT
jgi:putative ABC transport system permease protein